MTHPTIQRARDLLLGREQQETEAKEWREAHAEQILAAEVDTLLAGMQPIKRRDYDGGLRYRRTENARVEQPEQQPVMASEQQAAWDQWADRRIAQALANFRSIDLTKIFEAYSKVASEAVVRIVEAARRDIERRHKQRIVLFDPSEVMAREIQKHVGELRDKAKTTHNQLFDRVVALEQSLRAEITTLKKQVSELKERET